MKLILVITAIIQACVLYLLVGFGVNALWAKMNGYENWKEWYREEESYIPNLIFWPYIAVLIVVLGPVNLIKKVLDDLIGDGKRCEDVCKYAPPEKGNWPCEDCDMRFHDRAEPPEEETCVPAEEKEENFCADCHWFEVEEQYCFRNGCHAYNESTCEHWEPMPADEPIPAPGGKTVPTTYDLLYEEGGYNSNGV